MPHAHSFFTLLLLFLVFSTDGALYGHGLCRCQFSSYDGHDAVYVEQYYFNKMLGLQYNSTLGKIIGYTKKTKEIADFLNRDARFLNHEIWKTQLCKRNAPLFNFLLKVPVSSMLICSVYNFYPKQIRVTWLRDGKIVTADVTSTDELPNGNWLYQIHSYLEYTPRHGEKITCMVEHASLMRPKLYDWEPVSDPGMNKIMVGAAGLLLGLVFSVAGLIYFQMKSVGERLILINIKMNTEIVRNCSLNAC
uniref:Ig-like domain-containing protein n=1 Tax=Lates calcarifer TaxID=8187 RepID=A0A4W6CHG3_LATCA